MSLDKYNDEILVKATAPSGGAGYVSIDTFLSHAADEDAHHDPVSVGGGGLSDKLGLVNQVLTLGSIAHGDLLGIGADDHHDPVTAGSGVLVIGQEVGLDTPGALSASSSNTAAGNHTHAVTASASPGAAVSLLKTDAGGGLTLDHLGVSNAVNAGSGSFTGAVDVGQDLTVGANVLFVDESGQRVGINRAADAQFQLDVAGNMRASGYIVGQHAIQLPNANLIVHFDGAAPYETDFSGSALGHMGQVPTITGAEVYRPGRFGKALQVAEAAVNLCTNPVFDDLSSWSIKNYPTAEISSLEYYIGASSLHVVAPDSYGSQLYAAHFIGGLSEFTDYTVSIAVKTTSSNFTLDLVEFGGVSTTSRQSIVGDSGDWQKISLSVTTVAGTTGISVRLRHDGGATGGEAWFGAVQLEQKTYPTPFCYGDMPGHTWAGTPHASTSSRDYNAVKYPLTIKDTGSFMFWHKSTKSFDLNEQFLSGVDGDFLFVASFSVDGTNVYRVRASAPAFNSDPVDPLSWNHIALTWDETTAYLYINGEYIRSSPRDPFVIYPTEMQFRESTNGLIDDFIYTDHALDPALIKSIYESNAPVFAESSTWSFTLPNNLVWADEDGLWMRTAAGDAAFGMVGVDGKSWGGFTLDAGDFLVGKSSGDYLKLDVSAGLLELSGKLLVQGDSELVGPVSLGTDGGIYQGSGTFSSPTTGLKMWNDGGVGRIAGYKDGVLQAGFDTAGQLVAGGGDVVLGEDGINLGEGIGAYNSIDWLYAFSVIGSVNTYRGYNINVTRLISADTSGMASEIHLVAHSGGAGQTEFILGGSGAVLQTSLSVQDDISTDGHLYLGFNSSTQRLRRNGTHIEWYNGTTWVQLD